ncbi:MAG TPA: hypothetical protein VJ867_15885 [Gemmatimonadaceae bacterium]|nr:hypothetical protein [Gemmatimonadaceae bacterium]
MVHLAQLWLPILLSAVVVFVVSSLLHMILPFHKNDFGNTPNEAAVLDGLRHIPPGDYMMPRPSSTAEMRDPAFQEKMKRGPVAVLTVLPAWSPASFPRSLVLWFVYALVVGVFAAYVAGRALGPGTPYPEVFRFAGTTAFLGYGLALAQQSIWYGRRWSTTFKSMVDALVYALLTAAVMGWLWPR